MRLGSVENINGGPIKAGKIVRRQQRRDPAVSRACSANETAALGDISPLPGRRPYETVPRSRAIKNRHHERPFFAGKLSASASLCNDNEPGFGGEGKRKIHVFRPSPTWFTRRLERGWPWKIYTGCFFLMRTIEFCKIFLIFYDYLLKLRLKC